MRLPSFAVTVDGQAIDSTRLQYPLLEYKDIPYFPMTWNVGRGMGLRTEWPPDARLRIRAAYEEKQTLAMETGGSFLAGRAYQAHVADYPITVNAEWIDNASESYSLPEFQDVTYFPMTWRFAHDSFGWKTGRRVMFLQLARVYEADRNLQLRQQLQHRN